VRGGASNIYGNMGWHMKTTVDLPDELLIAAKKRAAEERLTLRELLVRGLRRELQARRNPPQRRRRIRWIIAGGGLPPGLDVADRERMHDWLARQV
jgi:hypothetical protein